MLLSVGRDILYVTDGAEACLGGSKYKGKSIKAKV